MAPLAEWIGLLETPGHDGYEAAHVWSRVHALLDELAALVERI